jgi:hypothetical protein
LGAEKLDERDEGDEPLEKQADPAQIVEVRDKVADPLFEERDQKLAVGNEEGQEVK